MSGGLEVEGYTCPPHGAQGWHRRNGVSAHLRHALDGDGAAHCRARRYRTADSTSRVRRFHACGWRGRCRGQVRVFWNLNAVHAVMWAIGQAVWTYLDLFAAGGVPVVTPTDPLFFAVEPADCGGAVRTAGARPAALAVRHRRARPGADRAVRRVPLHLLHRARSPSPTAARISTTRTSGSCTTPRTCCWRCGRSGCGGRRRRRRGGGCSASMPPGLR